MAWTAPMTAVANTVFTAASFNTYIRDNLLETLPAKANTPGEYFVSNSPNSMVARMAQSGYVDDSETVTTSTGDISYTDLPTTGPQVKVSTNTKALIIWSAYMSNSQSNRYCYMGVDISGSTNQPANDIYACGFRQTTGTADQTVHIMGHRLITDLNPGFNTFTARYRITAANGVATTGTFRRRSITVMPL